MLDLLVVLYTNQTLKPQSKLENKFTKQSITKLENRYLTKSGNYLVIVDLNAIRIRKTSLCHCKKHYAHKKIEEERNLLLANLTQINKELIVLSHKTSHDLKSPINNMLSVLIL
jgi:hypothetical protein